MGAIPYHVSTGDGATLYRRMAAPSERRLPGITEPQDATGPTLIHAAALNPRRWMLMLHGILGRGANWRAIANKLVEARPDWGFVLVDLRMHGGSQAGFKPPHTVAAAAEDLLALDALVPGPIRAVLGHSFGGKVALDYLARRAHSLERAFVIDTPPGISSLGGAAGVDSESERALRFLSALPPSLSSREAFVALAAEAGFALPVAQWLATNLVRDGAAFKLGVDLRAMRELLSDFQTTDLWGIAEHPPSPATLHIVIGDRSPAFSAADRARILKASQTGPRLFVHTLPTGHWVHVDEPFTLAALLLATLPPA